MKLSKIIAEYCSSGCPDARLQPRQFSAEECRRLQNVAITIGSMPAEKIGIPTCLEYRERRKTTKGNGDRTVDMELASLSNCLSWAVTMGKIPFNPIRSGRPRFRREEDVRHCREVAPKSVQEVRRLAEYFFRKPASAVLGWQTLFEAFTGCRTSEILAMRMDAKPGEPGHVSGDHLRVDRRKRGVNPFSLIHPELRATVDLHRDWHTKEFPDSPWYFPGPSIFSPVGKKSLVHALDRATKSLGIPKVTSHGLRSFYVTQRRQDGATDAQIAAEIGDRTVELIHRTYGDVPMAWSEAPKQFGGVS